MTRKYTRKSPWFSIRNTLECVIVQKFFQKIDLSEGMKWRVLFKPLQIKWDKQLSSRFVFEKSQTQLKINEFLTLFNILKTAFFIRILNLIFNKPIRINNKFIASNSDYSLLTFDITHTKYRHKGPCTSIDALHFEMQIRYAVLRSYAPLRSLCAEPVKQNFRIFEVIFIQFCPRWWTPDYFSQLFQLRFELRTFELLILFSRMK